MPRKILAVVVLLAFVPSAHAFIDPPYITPTHPAAGETVSVSVRSGICDAVGTIQGYPQITQQGSAIRILLWGVSSTDPILCNFPVGIGTHAVGAYAPGSYTLQVDRNFQDDLGGILTETLGVIPFTVAGGGTQPIALPASNTVSLIVLGFVLFVGARTKLHRAFSTDRHGEAHVLRLRRWRNVVSKLTYVVAVATSCLFATKKVGAFIDPPHLTPLHPTAGEEIFVSIRAGICDGIGSIPGYPQLIRSGNDIRITVWSDSFTDPILCNFPIGTSTYSIGSYGPGVYSLQVDRGYFGDLGETTGETIGVIPFAVSGGAEQPVPLPALNPFSSCALGLALLAIARSTLRRAPRSLHPS